jgi:hypothetical protein
MSERHVIVIFGMDADDREELLKHVPQDAVDIEEQHLEKGMKGEPASAMVLITLAGIALKGWLGYLILRGERSTFEQDIEIRDPRGGVKRQRIIVKHDSAAKVKASVLGQLASLGIPVPAEMSAKENADS